MSVTPPQPALTSAPPVTKQQGAGRPGKEVFLSKLGTPFRLGVQENRIYGLDVLRATAILFVLLAHGDNLHHFEPVKQFNAFIGFDGVSLFFVLSGFLIGGILLKVMAKGDYSFQALFTFWKRRWLRTLPAYYLVLTVLILLATFAGGTPMLQHSKRFYFFLQNFNTEHTVFFQEAWSLSVEEWFYLIVPTSLFLAAGAFNFPTRKSVLAIALLIILFSIGFRYYRHLHNTIGSFEEWDQLYRKQVVTRLDSLIFGVFGAYIAAFHKQFWFRHKQICLLAGVTLLIGMKLFNLISIPSYGLYTCVFSFDVEAFIVLLFLPYLSQLKNGSGKAKRIITHISLISYSLYLINFSLVQGWLLPQQAVFGLSETSFEVLRYLCYWVVTVGGATLLYKYVERPFMLMRR